MRSFLPASLLLFCCACGRVTTDPTPTSSGLESSSSRPLSIPVAQKAPTAVGEIIAAAVEVPAQEKPADPTEGLRDQDGKVIPRAACELALAGRDHADITAALAVVLRDGTSPDRPMVLQAAKTGSLATRTLTPIFLEMAQNAKDPLRLDAIEALGQARPTQEVVDALLQLAHEEDPRSRSLALRSLGKVDSASAKVQVTLRKALRDEKAEVRLAALEAIGRRGRGAMPELLQTLRHPDESLRLAAVETLRTLGPDAREAYLPLTRMTREDPAETVRRCAQAVVLEIDAKSDDSIR